MNGNRYEIGSLLSPNSLNLNYWDPANYEQHKWTYRCFIYPLVYAAMDSLLTQNCRVLELGAGDGEVAEHILQKHEGRIEQYHLVDLNELSCEEARKKLTTQKNAVVHQGDIVAMDYSTISDGQFEVVLGSGSFTQQVLPDRASALQALDKAIAKMNEGGYLVLCGVSPLWIRSSDLEERGLKVLNMGIPSKKWISYPLLQFCVAKKIPIEASDIKGD